MSNRVVISDIAELLSLSPLKDKPKSAPIEETDLGQLKFAWMAIDKTKIVATGVGPISSEFAGWHKLSARGGLVMPGLIDSHTHPVFAGDRSSEFSLKLAGESYQDIAASGGGILATVRATRAADTESLTQLARTRLLDMLQRGVTTIEAKSGYGLSVSEEIRHLRILRHLKESLPMTVVATCLGLHAVPEEANDTQSFIDDMTNILLPEVAREGLAKFVDAFVEKGYFEPDQLEAHMRQAKQLGLSIRIHADEFADSQAAEAASRWHAVSADHLQHASESGLRAMAKAGVIATLLPGTSLYSGLRYADARRIIGSGCRVAIASDFNPGSSYIDNLAMLAAVAGVHSKLRPWEILAAVTYVPSCSLHLDKSKGILAPGYDADFLIYEKISTSNAWLADFGQSLPSQVWVAGSQVA